MSIIIKKNLTDVDDCDTEANFTDDKDTAVFSGFQREGAACLGTDVSQTTWYGYFTVASTNITGQLVYVWQQIQGAVELFTNGGFRIYIGDGTNSRSYYVGGSDDYGFQIGGWSCVIFDPDNVANYSYAQVDGAAEPDFTAVTQIGPGVFTTSVARGGLENFFFDMLRYGYGLTVEGGTSGDPATFEQIAIDDSSTTADKAYGIMRELQSGIYGCQGQLIFGGVWFEDKNSILVFEDKNITDNFYSLSLSGSPAESNTFILGDKVGTGDTAVGANGCTIQSAGPGLFVDLNDANFATVNVYGSTILGATKGVVLSEGTGDEFIGSTITQSGRVSGGQCEIRNCTFSAVTSGNDDYLTNTYLGSDGALLWNDNIDIKNSSFLGNTLPTSAAAITHPTSGAYAYTNLNFTGNDYDILFLDGGTLTITSTDATSPPSTWYAPNGGTVDIIAAVTLTLTGLVSGSEVRIYEAGTINELTGVEDSDTSFAYPYNYVPGTYVDIVIHHVDYVYIRLEGFLLPSTTGTIPVDQQYDRWYSNP